MLIFEVINGTINNPCNVADYVGYGQQAFAVDGVPSNLDWNVSCSGCFGDSNATNYGVGTSGCIEYTQIYQNICSSDSPNAGIPCTLVGFEDNCGTGGICEEQIVEQG